jgi:hypothetical protein
MTLLTSVRQGGHTHTYERFPITTARHTTAAVTFQRCDSLDSQDSHLHLGRRIGLRGLCAQCVAFDDDGAPELR